MGNETSKTKHRGVLPSEPWGTYTRSAPEKKQLFARRQQPANTQHQRTIDPISTHSGNPQQIIPNSHALTTARQQHLLVLLMDEILKVFENNHVDPPWSHVLVLCLDAIATLAVIWCVRQVIESRRAALQAKRLEQSTLPMYEGARFVAGYVELAEGSTTAIRVTIEQQGTQTEVKNKYSHEWTEIDRQIEAIPFYVRTANGERVRVEPPIDVMLVDKLDQMEWHEMTRRRRRAELVPAERAVIEGVLRRGPDPELQKSGSYRAATAMGWIMHPTKKGGMFVSAESLSRRHELRARAFAWTTVWAIVLGIFAMSMVVPYRVRLLFGKTVVANYLGKETYETRNSKGQTRKHYCARVFLDEESGRLLQERFDVDPNEFTSLPTAPGRIWLRYVPAYPWATTLGKNASVASWQIFLAAAILGLSLYRIGRAYRHRRWYEGQVVEQGQGILPEPVNSRFLADTGHWPPKTKGPAAPIVERISADFTTETERRD